MGFHKYLHAKEKIIKWSSSAYKNQEFQFLDSEGRLFVDLLPLIKRDYKMDNYRLNTVSEFFLGDKKDDLSVKGIFKCYRVGTKKETDGSYSSKAKKVTNVLIADNNTLSFGDEKLELSNKDLILPESETLGWMSVLGPLYNDDDDIVFNSTVIDDYGNTYAVGYEHDDDNAIVVKFNKAGDKLWSKDIYDDDYGYDIEAISVKIDPVNGDLVVLCEIYPEYTEGLIVRIDPTQGYVKISHRLKDMNFLHNY
jgi:hypothetical protein